MANLNFPFHQDEVVEFCKRWKVTEFALFGSVLRKDFRPDSDVDVMVTFATDANWNLFDLVTMQDELQLIFNRKVDLVERDSLRNPFRRRAIMENLQIVYPS